jgi:hypothetical protein
LDRETAGRLFRQAWVEGVRRHYPGTPRDGYVAAWDEMPEWERASAVAVADQVAHFVRVSDGSTEGLTRDQRGQFIAICWIAQIRRHIPDPKPSYVTPWEELPSWQRETDAEIFDTLEQAVRAGP